MSYDNGFSCLRGDSVKIFGAALRDADRVLELRRQRAVARHSSRPIISSHAQLKPNVPASSPSIRLLRSG
jgi:hypothetical protein